MNLRDLQLLIAYNEWANDRILTCAEDLSEEQFTRPLVSSFPNLRDTLAHIVATEWVWLRRWKGESPRTPPEWMTAPSLARLRGVLRGVEEERAVFLSPLGTEDLERSIDFLYLSGTPGSHPLRELLQHVVNHSTFHRGQAVTMLRQVGGTPISTDLVNFYRDGRDREVR